MLGYNKTNIYVRTVPKEKYEHNLRKILVFLAPQVGFEPTTPRLTAECYYR